MGSRARCPPAPRSPQQEHPTHGGDGGQHMKTQPRTQREDLGQVAGARRAGQRVGEPQGLSHWVSDTHTHLVWAPHLSIPGKALTLGKRARPVRPSSNLSSFSSAQASDAIGPVPDAFLCLSWASCESPLLSQQSHWRRLHGLARVQPHPVPAPEGHSQLSRCSIHSCSSIGYLARSMSQATVEVILPRQHAGEASRSEASARNPLVVLPPTQRGHLQRA